ncbi:hypothetical protein FIBSPDRAFT_847953, partial [Athelia psychrophila]
MELHLPARICEARTPKSCEHKTSSRTASETGILAEIFDEHAGLHIRRLLEELLAMLFMHPIPDKEYPSPVRAGAAPLVLGQVCKFWRVISRAMPLLRSSTKWNHSKMRSSILFYRMVYGPLPGARHLRGGAGVGCYNFGIMVVLP